MQGMKQFARASAPLILFAALVPISGPGDASGLQSPEVIVEGKIPDDLKRVCKQTTATGSILPTRTCKTKADWERIHDRQIAQLDQLKRDMDRDRFTRLTIEVLCGGKRC
jgi:hypothetical protein